LKAIVHIGTEKTGTTSIQRFLYLNRKKLKNAGFYFIQSAGTMNNRAIPAYCMSDERFDDFFREEGISTEADKKKFKRRFFKEFENEIRSVPSNVHTIIISSEHFHSRLRTEPELDNVYNLLSPFFDEIKIVCYLREQVSTCTSYYSTHMKSGGTDSFAAFLQRCQPANYYFNYFVMLANWERCFGIASMDVSLFSQERFLNGDLLDDFTAKLNPALVGTLNKSIQVENESLNPVGQALARAINILFPVTSKRSEVNEMRDKCKKIINQRLTGKGQQPGLEVRKAIYNSFAKLNEQLRQKYFPEIEILFAPPEESSPNAATIDETDFEVITSVLSFISKHGKGTINPEDFSGVCSTIFSSVNDITKPMNDIKELGNQVVLSRSDVDLLRNTALRLEGRDIDTAMRLMSLASAARPNVAAIKMKLEEYSRKANQAPQHQYMFIYTRGKAIKELNEKDLEYRIEAWLNTLRVPTGSPLSGLGGTKIVSPDGSVADDKVSSMVGYTIIEAESLEAAISCARESPLLETGGSVHVTEVMQLPLRPR
jgi:hypothetical protein